MGETRRRRRSSALSSVGVAAAILAASVLGTAGPDRQAAAQPAAAEPLPPPVLSLVPDTGPVTVHSKSEDRCGPTKPVVMDSPIRVFMDDGHTIHMTTSDPWGFGFQWTGTSAMFQQASPKPVLDCAPIFDAGDTAESPASHDPADFDEKGFLQALHFKRGADRDSVYGFAHQDFYAKRVPGNLACANQEPLNECWYSAVSQWRSTVPETQEHINFSSAVRPNHVAIYPHIEYPEDGLTPKGGWIGYGAPSNIFRGRTASGALDGNWYMFVRSAAQYSTINEDPGYPEPRQVQGACLFANPDPANRAGWRAYSSDTDAFDRQMLNPYIPGAANQPCDVIAGLPNSPIRSVLWHRPSRHYVAISRTGEGGVVYSTSRDLVTWNPPRSLHGVAGWQADYPSMIDFDGGDQGDENFDRIYDDGRLWLYFRQKGGPELNNPETDIVRWRVKVGGIDPGTGKEYAPDRSGPESS